MAGFVLSGGALTALSSPSAAITGSYPRSVATYNGLTQAYEKLYASQPNIRTVVSFLGRNSAQLNFKLYRRVSDDEREHERDHGLARLLRHPNPRVSRYSFFRALFEDLGVFDNFIAVKVAGDLGRRALVRIPPQLVTPIGTNWLFPDGYRIAFGGRELDLSWERVVHLRGYNPVDTLWGLSPVETLRRILSEDTAAGEAREQIWGRGARASGIIRRPADAPKWKEPARERFRQGWSAAFAGFGPEAGGTPILEDGMEYERLTMSSQELEYLGARKLTRAEVAAAYHLTLNEDGTAPALIRDNLAPLAAFVAEELALQLLPDFEDGPDVLDELYLEANIDEKLRGDFLAEAEVISRATGAPWLTRNEARARRNLKALDGADELIVPLNVTTGGRASPADTAPGTPGLGQASRRERRTRSVKPAGAKADDDSDPVAQLPAELQAWVLATVEAVAPVLERQRNSVLSKLGAGDSPVEAFGRDDADRFPRWDSELGDVLAGLALEVAPAAAEPIAERFDSDFDVEVATAWLLNNARIAAEVFNDETFNAAADLYPAPTSRRQAEDELEPVMADVFEAALGLRLARFALDRTAGVGNFARHEAAAQAGATTKTWHTPSPRARASHAGLSGVTIPVGQRFSNGGLWPHDPALTADESAGCTCYVDFTEADVTN